MKTLTWRMFGHNGPYTVNFVHVSLQFKLQDMWIGVFWRNESLIDRIDYSIWICLLPMLPICIHRVKYLWLDPEDAYPNAALACQHCGQDLDYERCDQCEDGYSGHDCGEDCCACLDPEPNVTCEQCNGEGGWHFCRNTQCPGKGSPQDH